MARARNIKPGFFKNEVLGVADPLYSLLFEGLWVLADREGRLEDRPLRIQAEVFPYRAGLDMGSMLDWLQENGFILRYEVAGKRYILVLEFVKHQNPHKNESASDIPAPEEIGTTPEFIGSTRADSLIPDSLNSDSLHVPGGTNTAPEADVDGAENPEPRKRVSAPERPDGVEEQTWADWLQMRKKHRADVTATVLKEAQREAQKAGMPLQRFLEIWCLRGSRGLQADWLRSDERGRPALASEPTWRAEQRARTQQAAPGVAAGGQAADYFIDVDARTVGAPALPRSKT